MDLPIESTHDTDMFETSSAPSHSPQRTGELDIATIAAINNDGTVEIHTLEQRTTLRGISTVVLQPSDIGRQVAYMTAAQPQPQVIVIGLIRSSIDRLFDMIEVETTDQVDNQASTLENTSQNTLATDPENHQKSHQKNHPNTSPLTSSSSDHAKLNEDAAEQTSLDNVSIDGQRVSITGQEEVVLQCGEASITLRKDGKIIIRGKSLLNRASGVNRIMGASVQVN